MANCPMYLYMVPGANSNKSTLDLLLKYKVKYLGHILKLFILYSLDEYTSMSEIVFNIKRLSNAMAILIPDLYQDQRPHTQTVRHDSSY